MCAPHAAVLLDTTQHRKGEDSNGMLDDVEQRLRKAWAMTALAAVGRPYRHRHCASEGLAPPSSAADGRACANCLCLHREDEARPAVQDDAAYVHSTANLR